MAMQILLVDDNEDAVATLSTVLRMEGHAVRVARSGDDGYALAQQALPDIALLDIGLPGINGFELATRLRQLAAGRRLLIIAITGYGRPEHKAAGRKAGFDFYLTKPAEVTQILEILASYETAAPIPEALKRAGNGASVQSRVLDKAGRLMGGRTSLCRHLNVQPADLQKWIDEKTAVPLSILLRAVECILDGLPPAAASDPGEPAAPRDASSSDASGATRY